MSRDSALIAAPAVEDGTMTSTFRRVVTGLDADGRSAVLFDDREALGPNRNRLLWSTESVPADNSGRSDAAAGEFTLDMLRGSGSSFVIIEIPAIPNPDGTGMHATNTVDYSIVLRGRLELLLETGNVQLETGDFVVDRGIQHDWRALDGEPALVAVVTLPSEPVGAGATL